MQFWTICIENLYSVLINFIMPITYANQLCKLMSSQIDKMSNQNEDLKGHMPCQRRKIISSTE